MSTSVVERHFFAPESADFISVIQAYITGVASFTTNGTVSFTQTTRRDQNGFVDQQYDLVTYATPTNDTSILSFINTFIANNPSITFDTVTISASEGL